MKFKNDKLNNFLCFISPYLKKINIEYMKTAYKDYYYWKFFKKEMNEKQMKDELAELIKWSYNKSFVNLFTYNRADQSTNLSETSEAKISEIIKKLK